MAKEIQVRSKSLAESFVCDFPWAAISISSSEQFAKLNDNNRVSLLQLHFWDISTYTIGSKIFDKNHARHIIDFVEENWQKIDNLMIHCEAGQSRSPAVAAAIAHIKLGKGSENIWFKEKPQLNRYVFNTILTEYYGIGMAEMSAKAFGL